MEKHKIANLVFVTALIIVSTFAVIIFTNYVRVLDELNEVTDESVKCSSDVKNLMEEHKKEIEFLEKFKSNESNLTSFKEENNKTNMTLYLALFTTKYDLRWENATLNYTLFYNGTTMNEDFSNVQLYDIHKKDYGLDYAITDFADGKYARYELRGIKVHPLASQVFLEPFNKSLKFRDVYRLRRDLYYVDRQFLNRDYELYIYDEKMDYNDRIIKDWEGFKY